MILLQSLEKSGVLIDAVSETEKHQIKKKKGISRCAISA